MQLQQLTDCIPYEVREMTEETNVWLAQHDSIIKIEKRYYNNCTRRTVDGRTIKFLEPIEPDQLFN